MIGSAVVGWKVKLDTSQHDPVFNMFTVGGSHLWRQEWGDDGVVVAALQSHHLLLDALDPGS